MCVCGDAFVGCFLPSRRRKCQAGNFAMFTHRREHGERREVVVRRFPRPRFTQISFNPEKRELRQHFLPACFPYLICGNLRNRADGISEIEGKAARGRRASWETSDFQSRKGISEIEVKARWVAPSKAGAERVSISGSPNLRVLRVLCGRTAISETNPSHRDR